MFVARFVLDSIPSGIPTMQRLSLPVTKGYTALLRRITFSMSRGSEEISPLNGTPSLEISIQKKNLGYLSREGGKGYVGGIVAQPLLVYGLPGGVWTRYTMPKWGTRAFLALEQRYLKPTDEICVETYNWTTVGELGLRIEYTAEKLSPAELTQAFIR